MIKDEHELAVSKSWIAKFQQAIMNLHQNEEKRQNDPDGWQLLVDSYYAHIKNIQSEITEYESLKSHNAEQPLVLQNLDIKFDELGEVLVKVPLSPSPSPPPPLPIPHSPLPYK